MAAVLKTTEVRSRIDEGLKERATEVLEACGLTLSAAMRLFLEQVVAKEGLPFEVKRPSVKTARAIAETKTRQPRFTDVNQMFEALDGGKKEEQKASRREREL